MKLGLTVILLTEVLLCGMMFGCGGTNISVGTSEGNKNDGSPEAQADVIGKVTYVATTYISVTVYTADAEVEDYALLDMNNLTESEEAQSISTYSYTEYYKASGGTLTAAARDDIETGVMIASTTSEDVQHRIIILGNNPEDGVAESVESEIQLSDIFVFAAVSDAGADTIAVYHIGSDE